MKLGDFDPRKALEGLSAAVRSGTTASVLSSLIFAFGIFWIGAVILGCVAIGFGYLEVVWWLLYITMACLGGIGLSFLGFSIANPERLST